MNLSSCGIDCDACEYKTENKCGGCRLCAPKGKCVWGGRCALYDCASGKNLQHCGECGEFPCAMLEEWAKEGDGERIRNLKKLIKIDQN